jgi:tetratricopeptide (TPR) repeat protein
MASEDMANREAIAHLDRGLQLLDAVPADERARLEFELQVLRVKTLTHVRGYAHEDTLASWRRVRAIDQADVDPVRMTSAWSGYCAALLSAGDFEGALRESRELLDFAASTDEPLGQIAGLQGVGFSLFHLGRLAEARSALLEAVEAYDPEGHRFFANGFPTDAGVSASCWLIWVEWLAGRPEASAAAAERANALAARLGNPYTAAFARAWSAVGGVLSRDTARALRLGDETIAMADESGFPLLRAIGAFAKHSAEALLGDASGVDRYREAIRAAASAGNRSSVPLIFGTLADCQLAHGLYDDAMASVEAGLSLSAETGQPFYNAELRRIAGDVALARAAGSGAEVESCEEHFREAMRLARAQGARGLELRGAVSLARALRRAGRSGELADLLEPALEQIEGGQESSDVRDARALLHEPA